MRISTDGVALKADVALEAEIPEHPEKGFLVVVAAVQGLDKLPPTVAAFLGSAGADLPEQGLGIGEGGFEVGLWLDLEVMTEVEHHPDVVALAFAGHPHGIAEGVYVKAGMRIEHDTQAGLLGLVGDFPYEGDGLLVGVGFLAPLDEQLENGIPSLEVLDRLANFLAIAVPVGSQSAPYVKAEEFEPRLVVELETLENAERSLWDSLAEPIPS